MFLRNSLVFNKRGLCEAGMFLTRQNWAICLKNQIGKKMDSKGGGNKSTLWWKGTQKVSAATVLPYLEFVAIFGTDSRTDLLLQFSVAGEHRAHVHRSFLNKRLSSL